MADKTVGVTLLQLLYCGNIGAARLGGIAKSFVYFDPVVLLMLYRESRKLIAMAAETDGTVDIDGTVHIAPFNFKGFAVTGAALKISQRYGKMHLVPGGFVRLHRAVAGFGHTDFLGRLTGFTMGFG